MRGAKQHHAADLCAPASEQGIGVPGDRAAVDVAGMRGDQQLRPARSVVGADTGDVVRNLRAQRGRRGGVEQAVDDGPAYGGH